MKRRRKPNKLKHWLNDFTTRIGMSPLRILMSLVLLIGIGALIWTVAFPPEKPIRETVESPTVQKLKEIELTTDQRLERLLTAKPPETPNFLMVIEDMQARNKELDEVIAGANLSESQQTKADLIRLRNDSVAVLKMVQNNVECDVEKAALKRMCRLKADHPDEELREAARFWLCAIPTIEFTENPNEMTFEEFTQSSEEYSDGYLLNPAHAAIISGLVNEMRRKNKSAQYVRKGHEFLKQQMAKSELPNVKAMGDKLAELAVYGDFNLPTLGNRISWSDPTAESDLAGAFQVFQSDPESTKFETWATLVRAYENFLATDKIEETGDMWNSMLQTVEGMKESNKRTTMLQVLQRQRARALKIGKEFDVSGFTYPDNVPFDLSSEEYTLVIFCNKQRESMQALIHLGNLIQERQPGYRPILALEDDLTQADADSMEAVPTAIKVASRETALKYMEQFPVDFFPYLILIDKKGVLVSANVDLDQVPNRIAKIEAAARKAARAAVDSTSESQ